MPVSYLTCALDTIHNSPRPITHGEHPKRFLGMILSIMLALPCRILGTVKSIDHLDALTDHRHVHQVVGLADVPPKFVTTWLAGREPFPIFEL